MKIIFRTAAVAALILATSCGKDTVNVIADIFDTEIEELENTVLDEEKITDNVIIVGGTKMEGTPPSPNGAISLELSDSGKIAFLDEGFEVSLSSDAELTGAYIQFKSKDGSISDSYYDINLDANSTGENGKSSRRRRVKRNSQSKASSKTDGFDLDVDFNTNIEPGEFCYEICVYDAQGNISDPQEVCVTVESWGGNSSAIGKWTVDKWFYDNNPERIYLEGEDNCVSGVNDMYCQGITFEDVERENCTFTGYWFIELKADGSYIEKEKLIWTTRYRDISQNPCLDEDVDEDVYTYENAGKWSYIDDEDKFVFIAYFDQEVYDGESSSYTAEPGDGWIYYGGGGYDGEVSISDVSLIVKSFEETTAHFKK